METDVPAGLHRFLKQEWPDGSTRLMLRKESSRSGNFRNGSTAPVWSRADYVGIAPDSGLRGKYRDSREGPHSDSCIAAILYNSPLRPPQLSAGSLLQPRFAKTLNLQLRV
jgi:hypothetical protein